MKFYAHIREKDKDLKDPQILWTHLFETSVLAENYAGKIGLPRCGKLLGLLHDLGKASHEFQNYLLSGEGILDSDADDYIDPSTMRGKIDHSTAGAQTIYKTLFSKSPEGKLTGQLLSMVIASHHSGLIDCLTPEGVDNFTRRLEKSEEKAHFQEAYSNLDANQQDQISKLLSDELLIKEVITKVSLMKEENESKETFDFKLGLLARFLLSCLLDADRLNTADFESPGNTQFRNQNVYPSWKHLVEKLNLKINQFAAKIDKNEVDILRNRVSQSCFDFSAKPKGIFQLTVPTGGGKTFASLRFALNHADKHAMDRIFYVIPYTSIIDQNAEEARKVLEEKDQNGHYLHNIVLEHHSNLTPDEETRRQKLLAENWDAPIVFTTQVQFLESVFGSGTRNARRMHQFANSIIIFDEVQMVPIRIVHMFNLAIRFLVHSCGATVVLCTATQPLLDQVEPKTRSLIIKPENKIIQYEEELFNQLKRVNVFDKRRIGGWNEEQIVDLTLNELHAKGSVLIVVNTKKSAKSLFNALSKGNNPTPYHLSTSMCPAHRLVTLEMIKEKLAENSPVICVSTQLIEAGVDIDFGSVIRYLAGMDSITQAAGRCNRNGFRLDGGNVWIVNPTEENIDKLDDIKIGSDKAQTILDNYNQSPEKFDNDRIGLKSMKSYYQHYFFERKTEMSYPVHSNSSIGRADDLFNILSTNKYAIEGYIRISGKPSSLHFKQSFQSAAKAFRVIESPSIGVIVPYKDEGNQVITDLCGAFEIEKQWGLIKKAQRYSVNLFRHEFEKLADKKIIREVQKGAGIFYLDKQFYSKDFGWSDEPVSSMEKLFH